MRQISVEGLELIGKGVTASVYALDDKTILKLFRPVVPQKDIGNEYFCAGLVNSLGVPTPAAREIVQCGPETGIVYDRVHGVTLAEEITAHPGEYSEYGKRYGSIVRALHSRKVPHAAIPQAEPFLEGLFEDTHALIPEAEKAELLSYLRLLPDADNLLHGDISPVNIMVENGRLEIIDVPTIMKGHPVFDLLQPYAYCHMTTELYERYLSLPEAQKQSPAGRFMARFGRRYLGREAAAQVWDGFFEAYFGQRPAAFQAEIEQILRFYNGVKLMGSVYMLGKFEEEVVRFLVAEGRAQVKTLAPSVADRIAALDPEVFA